jgi:hypothetical protein
VPPGLLAAVEIPSEILYKAVFTFVLGNAEVPVTENNLGFPRTSSVLPARAVTIASVSLTRSERLALSQHLLVSIGSRRRRPRTEMGINWEQHLCSVFCLQYGRPGGVDSAILFWMAVRCPSPRQLAQS